MTNPTEVWPYYDNEESARLNLALTAEKAEHATTLLKLMEAESVLSVIAFGGTAEVAREYFLRQK